MKKVLQYSGIISLILGAVAFILMFATPAIRYEGEGTLFGITGHFVTTYEGANAIFGSGSYTSVIKENLLGTVTTKVMAFEGSLAWNALLAWIFILAALVILLLGIVLPIFKVKALDKFSGVLNLVSICLLIVAGVLMFFTLPTFATANEWNNTNGCSLGAGWVISSILAIAGGVFAALPTIADFLKK